MNEIHLFSVSMRESAAMKKARARGPGRVDDAAQTTVNFSVDSL